MEAPPWVWNIKGQNESRLVPAAPAAPAVLLPLLLLLLLLLASLPPASHTRNCFSSVMFLFPVTMLWSQRTVTETSTNCELK